MGQIIGEGITFDDVLLVPSYSQIIANQVDLMVVIGDKKSSNTHSLYERIRTKVSTLFIEDCSEIISIDKSVKLIGLTAGCSTPNFQIESVVKKLQDLQKE